MTKLIADNLRLETPDGRCLLDRLSITITLGQRWAILGENGVGKSTLLRCLAGLNDPASGHLDIAGAGFSSAAKTLAKIRSHLPQEPSYPPEQTVLETVLAARYPHRGFWQWFETAEDRRIAHEAIGSMDLQSLVDRPLGSLSGGEARRVAIAAVIAQGAPWMLLDEPTSFLDLHRQRQALSVLSGMVTGQPRALIVALQDPNLAMRYCSHCLLLFGDGQWIAGETSLIVTDRNLSRLYHHPISNVSRSDGIHFFAL